MNYGSLNSLGRIGEARSLLQRAILLDPLDERLYQSIGFVDWSANRLIEAEAAYRKALDLNTGNYDMHFAIAQVLFAAGNPSAALSEWERSPDEADRLYGRALAYYALGRIAEADAALIDLEKKYAKQGVYSIAQIHAHRGEIDQAFTWLDKACRLHDQGCINIKVDTYFENIRSDSRYKALLQQMKLPV
jgi:tetratricopeptide (TPR) repeat protein